MSDFSIRPFALHVDEADVEDLRTRLDRTRFAPRIATGWKGGTDPDYLREFVQAWSRFDWREAERELNRLPQFVADIDGTSLHVVHVRGITAPGAPPPIPLVLTHGWPSSILEFSRLTPLLTDPAAHGGDPLDAFDVIIPSLPGFGVSSVPREGPVEPFRIASLWAELMSGLGYARFGATGGDIGSHVTNVLGAEHAERMIGIHTHHPPLHPVLDPAVPLSDVERAYLAAFAAAPGNDSSYAQVQANRPDSIGAALSDSPAGLAAWMLEKYRDWGDCGGDIESVFPRETLMQIVSLYWFTGSIATSFRPYVDDALTPPLRPIHVPAAVSLTPEDADYPREFAERTYADLRQFRGPENGGHFLALENPERLARDLADFFRPLRDTA